MRSPYVLVTGGAGFIGTNLVSRLAELGRSVLVYDNLSRPGVEDNLVWLLGRYGDRVHFVKGDVRDSSLVHEAVQNAESVFHLAAQVAVTTSLVDPVTDFEINARGTLNVLEAVRARANPPFLLYTSTNKVLGGLDNVVLEEQDTRYEPADEEMRRSGVSEAWGMDFCSPYGCSKGAADQYVLDYARCFSIPAVVLRMSCIYGPHQCGNEDQGWVAHFIKQAIARKTITFYGNGKQVRDALFVSDLVDAFLTSQRYIEKTAGQAFNIGGGPENSVSLVELVRMLGSLEKYVPEVRREDWRPSDQRYYVSDTSKFRDLTGWEPKTSLQEGIAILHRWFKQGESDVRRSA